MDQDLAQRVRTWIDGDPDPRTRNELEALLAAGDTVGLDDRFAARLVFGTAGIRGEVGAGPARLNRAVAIQTAAGLADHLRHAGHGGGLVIVGHDARPDSPAFAEDVARVLVAAQLTVAFFDGPTPTPIVAHAAVARDAVAAVVVTASHNPPADNGIKVYAADGVQIVPPTDVDIAARIEQVGAANAVPRAGGELAMVVEMLGDGARQAYVDDMLAARRHVPDADARRLTIVATPMHGVGGRPLVDLLAAAGHHVSLVAAQAEPDGTFPTVAFPNPEEDGALDLLLADAVAADADLALANDPDADRLAVALPDAEGRWHALTGNQVGVLLADALLQATPAPATGRRVVASSIVSSPQLRDVAVLHDADHEVTLTGFKWIWTALLARQRRGDLPVMGYEEALGYAVTPAVRDKDGLSAALAIVDLATVEAARGRTLWDRLDDLARSTGQWVSVQHSSVLDGPDGPDRIVAALGALRRATPDVLGDRRVTAVVDHLQPNPDRPAWFGAQNLLEFQLEGGRALIRPSGTEPKVKAYVDLSAPAAPGDRPRAGEADLLAEADRIARDLLGGAGLA